MTINLTGLDNATNVLDLVTYVNTNASGMFITLVLVALFFILFMNLRKYGAIDALIGAAFPSFILSILFKSLGLINFAFVILFFIITAFGVIFKYLQE